MAPLWWERGRAQGWGSWWGDRKVQLQNVGRDARALLVVRVKLVGLGLAHGDVLRERVAHLGGEDLALLPRVVDAHGEVADAVGGQGLPRLDVAPLGRVQLKLTYGRVRFHNLVIQLKKCIKWLVNMKFAIK